MKTVDRVACLTLVALAFTGPGLLVRATRWLEPRLAVSVAWAQAGGGPTELREDDPPPTALDPWGRPFFVQDMTISVLYPDGCRTDVLRVVVSQGPSGEDPLDHIQPSSPHNAHPLRRAALEQPSPTALGLVLWLALAWAVLRRARRRPLPAEAALALAAALPAAPVAWAVAHTERVATLSLPQVVPAALAVGLTLSGLAFVVALAVRLASRPDEELA
ncbi:MAG: hypothetical protein KF878_29240 [Planctomycetes bacterium]|nr:hypothetical protein [Planctomycetota bacterium]